MCLLATYHETELPVGGGALLSFGEILLDFFCSLSGLTPKTDTSFFFFLFFFFPNNNRYRRTDRQPGAAPRPAVSSQPELLRTRIKSVADPSDFLYLLSLSDCPSDHVHVTALKKFVRVCDGFFRFQCPTSTRNFHSCGNVFIFLFSPLLRWYLPNRFLRLPRGRSRPGSSNTDASPMPMHPCVWMH